MAPTARPECRRDAASPDSSTHPRLGDRAAELDRLEARRTASVARADADDGRHDEPTTAEATAHARHTSAEPGRDVAASTAQAVSGMISCSSVRKMLVAARSMNLPSSSRSAADAAWASGSASRPTKSSTESHQSSATPS